MKDYVAWLNGTSVARGTLSEVERKAKEIFASKLWQQNEGSTATLRITRTARQYFVTSKVLHAGRPTLSDSLHG